MKGHQAARAGIDSERGLGIYPDVLHQDILLRTILLFSLDVRGPVGVWLVGSKLKPFQV